MKVKNESEVAQSCPTLSDPMDCSLPGSSIHGIFQAGVLEWGAIAFSHPRPTESEISRGGALHSVLAALWATLILKKILIPSVVSHFYIERSAFYSGIHFH